MLRLRVQTIRSLLWLGNLIVILAIAGLLANIAMKRDKLTPRLDVKEIERYMKASGTIETGGGRHLLDWSEYKKLWTLNVVGKDPPPPPAPVDPRATAPVAQAKPITDVVRVVFVGAPVVAQMVYVEDQPSNTMAMTPAAGRGGAATGNAPTDPTKRHDTKIAPDVVHVGDALRSPYDAAPYDGKVVRIDPSGVVFHWQGEEVLVNTARMPEAAGAGVRTMPGIDENGNVVPGTTVDRGSPEERQAAAELVRESHAMGEHGWFIGTDERDEIIENHEKLLAEIKVTNYVDRDGKSQQLRLRLDKVPEESFAYRHGLREGDVLQLINGEKILALRGIPDFVKRNPSVSTYQIEIKRDGAVLTKVFRVAK